MKRVIIALTVMLTVLVAVRKVDAEPLSEIVVGNESVKTKDIGGSAYNFLQANARLEKRGAGWALILYGGTTILGKGIQARGNLVIELAAGSASAITITSYEEQLGPISDDEWSFITLGYGAVGINVMGDLTITGPGSLTVNNLCTRSMGGFLSLDPIGINVGLNGWTDGSLVVTAGAHIQVNTAGYTGINIDNQGSVNVLGASVELVGGSGIYARGDINLTGAIVNALSLSGSCLTCSGNVNINGTFCALVSKSGNAIYSSGGKMVVDDSILCSLSSLAPCIVSHGCKIGKGYYKIGTDGSVETAAVGSYGTVEVDGGVIEICSPSGTCINVRSDGSSESLMLMKSGLVRVKEHIDIKSEFLLNNLLNDLHGLAMSWNSLEIEERLQESTTIGAFLGTTMLDFIKAHEIKNPSGASKYCLYGVDASTKLVMNGGTILSDVAEKGNWMEGGMIITGGSLLGKVGKGMPVNASAKELVCVENSIPESLPYHEVKGGWTVALPSYYGTGSLYADAAGKLYFWVPGNGNVPGGGSGGGSGGGTGQTNMPDLVPYTPSGWSAPIVVAKDTASTKDATGITANDNLYLKFAVVCRGGDVTSEIYFALYVDGVKETSWRFEGYLPKDEYVLNTSAYALGKLSAGKHTFKLVADSLGVVAESDEGNNAYIKTVTVGAASYVVTFNANGGAGGTTRTVEYGKAIGALPTPTRSGYTFAGWFTAASGGTKVLATTVVSGNVTYYAHWTKNDASALSGAYVADKARVFSGAAYNSSAAVGVVSLKVGKSDKKGVFKVSGTLTTIDGKKHSIRATAATASGGFVTIKGIAVAGIGTLTLKLAANGFSGTLSNGWTVRMSNIADLRKGNVVFDLSPYPVSISGVPVKTEYLPMKLKGVYDGKKIAFPKAGRVSYKKDHFEVSKGGEGNPSALKLTLSPKTGIVKGSFLVYTFNGRSLKGSTAKVTGLLVDGNVYMAVTVPRITFNPSLRATLEPTR